MGDEQKKIFREFHKYLMWKHDENEQDKKLDKEEREKQREEASLLINETKSHPVLKILCLAVENMVNSNLDILMAKKKRNATSERDAIAT